MSILHGLLTRITAVWLLLVGATGLSWKLGHHAGFAEPRYAGAAVLVVSFVKVRLVMREFMELRTAPPWLRLVGDLWVVAVAALLIGLYWRG